MKYVLASDLDSVRLGIGKTEGEARQPERPGLNADSLPPWAYAAWVA